MDETLPNDAQSFGNLMTVLAALLGLLLVVAVIAISVAILRSRKRRKRRALQLARAAQAAEPPAADPVPGDVNDDGSVWAPEADAETNDEANPSTLRDPAAATDPDLGPPPAGESPPPPG